MLTVAMMWAVPYRWSLMAIACGISPMDDRIAAPTPYLPGRAGVSDERTDQEGTSRIVRRPPSGPRNLVADVDGRIDRSQYLERYRTSYALPSPLPGSSGTSNAAVGP